MSFDFEIEVKTPIHYDGEDFCWFHPRVTAVPGAGRHGSAAVVMTQRSTSTSRTTTPASTPCARTTRAPFGPVQTPFRNSTG